MPRYQIIDRKDNRALKDYLLSLFVEMHRTGREVTGRNNGRSGSSNDRSGARTIGKEGSRREASSMRWEIAVDADQSWSCPPDPIKLKRPWT